MGHSIVCEFDGRLIIGTKEARVGVKNVKEGKTWFLDSCKTVKGFTVDKVILWPQTKRARNFTAPYDYIELTRENVTRKYVTE